MHMTETYDKLKKLQKILADKYDLEAKKDELPKTLVGSSESLERFKKEYIEKNAEYEAEKAKVAALKLELKNAESARENGEKGMDSISTHREYEALDKQINEASEKEQNIRKDLQKEEKSLAELDEIQKSNEDLIKSTEKDVTSMQNKISKEVTDCQDKLNDLDKQEKEITTGLDSDLIYKFTRIIKRNREGIVAVKGNVCEGCHMILPSQFANEVHRGDKIMFCPYCSRILFYEEAKEEENETSFYHMDDTNNLEGMEEDLLDEDQYDESDEDSIDENSDDENNNNEDDNEMNSNEYEENN